MDYSPCIATHRWDLLLERNTESLDVGPDIIVTVSIPKAKEYMYNRRVLGPVYFVMLVWYATRQAMDMSQDIYLMWDKNHLTKF